MLVFKRQEGAKEKFVTKLVTNMEGAIKTVVMQFLSSARGKESLGGKNFQKLVQSQLGNILSDTDSSSAVKDMMKGLDDNQDGKVSFQEYLTLVGYLANSLSEQKTQSAAASGQ
ncbi:hypothetical protein QQF64_009976 [Cirrhinus molitorella]|uniref:EF-hand domain-containing protein n=1 Tax=Cirrhinus molitorella TaxID=172907 RepID=A0ABR3M2P5_9TELE